MSNFLIDPHREEAAVAIAQREDLIRAVEELRYNEGALQAAACEMLNELCQLQKENEHLKKSLSAALSRSRFSVQDPPEKKRGLVMRFGKHKGKLVKDIPVEYARWLLSVKRDDILRDGCFERSSDMHLGPALMKVVLGKGIARLDDGIRELVVEHKKKYRSFDDQSFLAWVGSNKMRKLRILWLGIAFYNKQRHKEKAIKKLAEKSESEQPCQVS